MDCALISVKLRDFFCKIYMRSNGLDLFVGRSDGSPFLDGVARSGGKNRPPFRSLEDELQQMLEPGRLEARSRKTNKKIQNLKSALDLACHDTHPILIGYEEEERRGSRREKM